jgi:hypothetical protein
LIGYLCRSFDDDSEGIHAAVDRRT